MNITLRSLLILSLAFALSAVAFAGGAKITIVNNNAPGVGFNDPTPATPVGGNPGTTLGQQRLNAFQFAANTWGANLDSAVEIKILASFEPLACTATAATLGSAGTRSIWSDFSGIGLFPGAEFPATWYGAALANKRSGVDIPALAAQSDPTVPVEAIRARFNSNLGNPGCLTGTFWYLGYDANHGANIDLVTVLLHEFAHGLGFQQFADVTTGVEPAGQTDVYGRLLLDTTTHKTWDVMTDAERKASSINIRRVVLTGHEATASLPGVLSLGTPLLRLNSPASVAGTYAIGASAFGPQLSSPGVTGDIVIGKDPADAAGPSTTDGCEPFTNASDVAGKIALVDRGTCTFVVKVKNAQNAGAIGVLIADNAAGAPPGGNAGVDPTIVIPSVRISLADGTAIKAALASGSVNGTLGVDNSIYAGADPLGRGLVYTPQPVAPGSTISHWDTIAFRNLLMEPAINPDLTHSVKPPEDLTLPLLHDVGWFPDADNDGLADDSDQCKNSDLSASVSIGSCATGISNTLFTNGCTVKDFVDQAAAASQNHGDFVSAIAHLSDSLKSAGIISGAQKGKMQTCAAGASIP